MEKRKTNNTPIFKKWWFWLIIVVVIFGVIGAATQGSQGDVDKGQTASQDTSGDKLADLAVGDSVTICGVTVTVNSISDGQLVFLDTTPTYDVSITYRNNSGKAITISPYDWATVLHSGSDKAHVGGDTSFRLASLDDGAEWTGVINLWADGNPEKIALES